MRALLFGASLLCLSSAAVADEAIDRTIEAAKDGYVEIEHVNGSAEIQAWDKAEVKVTGRLSDRTQKFIFERRGNEVLIKVKVKNNKKWGGWGSDGGDRLKIFVPLQSKVSYSAVNADVELEGIKGGAKIETVNGAIDAEELAGRIRMESVNGSVSAKELEGDVRVETVNGSIYSTSSLGKEDVYESVNGDIEIKSDSGDIRVETVNGDMELDLGEVYNINLDTVNGSIDAKMNLLKNGELEASSVGGSMAFYFQDDVSAKFDIEGHAGGRITNKLSEHKVKKAKYGPNRWLEFSLNGGNAKVNLSTISGRIKLDTK